MTSFLLDSQFAFVFQLSVLIAGGTLWHLFQFWSGDYGWRGIGTVVLLFLFGSVFTGRISALGLWLYDVHPLLVAWFPVALSVALIVVQPGEGSGEGRTERPTTAPGKERLS